MLYCPKGVTLLLFGSRVTLILLLNVNFALLPSKADRVSMNISFKLVIPNVARGKIFDFRLILPVDWFFQFD